jgi:predicted metallopeptidase
MYETCQGVDCGRGSAGRLERGKRTIARCHALPKVLQLAMEVPAHYAIEFLERFERLSRAEQDMTIIHELLHIPKAFGGGFRHHDFVSHKNVEQLYKAYLKNQTAS